MESLYHAVNNRHLTIKSYNEQVKQWWWTYCVSCMATTCSAKRVTSNHDWVAVWITNWFKTFLTTRCSRGCFTNTFVIYWLICETFFKKLSFQSHMSLRANMFEVCSTPTTCNMSHVKCHMPCVTIFFVGVGDKQFS